MIDIAPGIVLHDSRNGSYNLLLEEVDHDGPRRQFLSIEVRHSVTAEDGYRWDPASSGQHPATIEMTHEYTPVVDQPRTGNLVEILTAYALQQAASHESAIRGLSTIQQARKSDADTISEWLFENPDELDELVDSIREINERLSQPLPLPEREFTVKVRQSIETEIEFEQKVWAVTPTEAEQKVEDSDLDDETTDALVGVDWHWQDVSVARTTVEIDD